MCGPQLKIHLDPGVPIAGFDPFMPEFAEELLMMLAVWDYFRKLAETQPVVQFRNPHGCPPVVWS